MTELQKPAMPGGDDLPNESIDSIHLNKPRIITGTTAKEKYEC